MIYKLTLETEHPEYLMNFLQAYGYLRTGYPIDTSDIQDDRVYAELFRKDKKYRELLKREGTEFLETETNWLCDAVREAFAAYVGNRKDREYLLSQFSVEVVGHCDGEWDNGKAFYVFPTSYSAIPVLQF